MKEKMLKGSACTPFPSTYKPELDVTWELNADLASRYSQLIGILRWAIEIGRLDIYTETSMLSQHLALPREGHLEMVYHIFAYLKQKPHSKLVFDPKEPNVDDSVFPADSNWSDFYGEVEEELPRHMPKPLGSPARIGCFVDANHAGNLLTRRSHTGILVFIMNAPILWLSKRQNTVESSTFGSKFVALHLAKEMLVALCYKLRMFEVPIDGYSAGRLRMQVFLNRR